VVAKSLQSMARRKVRDSLDQRVSLYSLIGNRMQLAQLSALTQVVTLLNYQLTLG